MNYVIDHIPRNTPCNRRSGNAMSATTITLHNTGNPTSTARNERGWLTNPSNNVTASYHIVVDEREAIECLPLTEHGWHAGDSNGPGNRTSIGIEICESGDYAKTLANAAQMVAKLLQERGWGVDRLRRHFDWSGKICPRLMYDGGKWTGWTAFKGMVESNMKPKETKAITHIRRFKRTAVTNSTLIRAQGKGETLEQMYARLPDKPTYLINGGFYNMADGWTLAALKVDGEIVREKSSVPYGYVLAGAGPIIKIHTMGSKSFEDIAYPYDWAIEMPLVVPVIAGLPASVSGKEPRAAIAYAEKSDEWLLMVTDGRPDGLTPQELKDVLIKEGATSAPNLDGGLSGGLLYNGKRINKQPELRPVANAIAIWVDEPKPAYKDSDVITYGDLKKLGLI